MSMSLQDMQDTLAALAEVFVYPPSLFWDHAHRSFFHGSNNKVVEEESTEDPPALASVNGLWRELMPDYESLLGVYYAETRRIVLYKRGIEWLANDRSWAPGRLERVVRLHEWAHALHHLGVAKWSTVKGMAVPRGFAERNARFRAAPDELKEQIAQLCTLVVLRGQAASARQPKARSTLQDMESIFFSLMSSQSARYRLPDEVRQMDLPRLHAKLALLFRMADERIFPRLDDVADILR